MSELVPLPCCDVAVSAQNWREYRSDFSSDATKVSYNEHCDGSDDASVVPATVLNVEVSEPSRSRTGSSQPDGGGTVEVVSEMEGSNSDHMPKSVNTPEDSSLDLMTIVKHKPSVIVFCDHDNQTVSASEDSDTKESTPPTSKERANCDGEDAFPETLQFKEFPVSRRRRNLNRNRKILRKRPDALPKSVPLDSRNPSSQGKSVFTGSQEQQDTLPNNGIQQVSESVLLLKL